MADRVTGEAPREPVTGKGWPPDYVHHCRERGPLAPFIDTLHMEGGFSFEDVTFICAAVNDEIDREVAERLRATVGGSPSAGLDAMIERKVTEQVWAALVSIEEGGCEAAQFHGEDGRRWDSCLDPEYTEGSPVGRCHPCIAHWALSLRRAAPSDAGDREPGEAWKMLAEHGRNAQSYPAPRDDGAPAEPAADDDWDEITEGEKRDRWYEARALAFREGYQLAESRFRADRAPAPDAALREALLRIFDMTADQPTIRDIARAALHPAPAAPTEPES